MGMAGEDEFHHGQSDSKKYVPMIMELQAVATHLEITINPVFFRGDFDSELVKQPAIPLYRGKF